MQIFAAEIARLNVLVASLQRRESASEWDSSKKNSETETEALAEARAALEAERAGAARIERALAAALKDTAELAARLHSEDAIAMPTQPDELKPNVSSNISALDSFLAD